MLLVIAVPVVAVIVAPPSVSFNAHPRSILSNVYLLKEALLSRTLRNSRARTNIKIRGRIPIKWIPTPPPLRDTFDPSEKYRRRWATRGSRVNGLHCTFKRPPPCCDSHPFAYRAVLRDYSAMTNECSILRGSHPRPPCVPLSAITPTHELSIPRRRSNTLLVFVFRKTNWRRTPRITTVGKGWKKKWSAVYVTWNKTTALANNNNNWLHFAAIQTGNYIFYWHMTSAAVS